MCAVVRFSFVVCQLFAISTQTSFTTHLHFAYISLHKNAIDSILSHPFQFRICVKDVCHLFTADIKSFHFFLFIWKPWLSFALCLRDLLSAFILVHFWCFVYNVRYQICRKLIVQCKWQYVGALLYAAHKKNEKFLLYQQKKLHLVAMAEIEVCEVHTAHTM